ncbi:RNB domain-containing ribonuclease [Allopusillimonas soli]|uniref:RNB domain-containing ribonuclease n=1 Tax=Allopusillimonas soli TaxID=659016 RepID=A0A853F8N6_9BURK|nr:ribonuclease catalytic domain-containing protein [Allopusillimonas soli]NYT36168.1 RNB domain-containing ribonuclease [Allopusillimonas soli]TEA76501.1 RNB domain-containing ribonuclease [Allopusillimonas soli]
MYVLYEESGNFKAAKIFSDSDSTMQVESESGKRSKIKKASVLFQFEQPGPADLLTQARTMADTFEIDFLWECAPQQEFEAAAFAQEYFGHTPSAVEKAALIFALNAAPAYFHRRGKGCYRPAPPDILQAALAAIEKKRQQAIQQQAWTDALVSGSLPAEIAAVAGSLITRPDKNSMQWKAFEAAVQQLQTTPEKLLLSCGAWPHALALHQYRFFANHFPKGTQLPAADPGSAGADLPLAQVQAYSVDDSSTIEIDDALSVTPLDGDRVRVGVHIAVPGLAVTRGSDLDAIARGRMSTVYIPGLKVPMLPAELIAAFSLDAGSPRPALSLYVDADLSTGEILATETRLERITVCENLRHNQLDEAVTEESLDNPEAPLPYAHWLRPLWRLARHLCAQREAVRGKPENNNRVDYSFELDGPYDDPDTPVKLIPRRRNAPLDRLVAEFMILANATWGGLLARHGVPGIYRSQQMGRVRMSTQALPHEAIGVPQYAWSTSPLRRYVDMVNQWQILSAAEHGVSARLAAPFKPKDADLYAIIGAFDAQYAAWGDFQSAMERYWCMRWMQQQGMRTVQGAVIRDDLVRLDCAPFVTRVPALPALERGQSVTLDVLGFDELSLELDCRLRETAAA